jgi:hypothetical protein
MLSVHFVSVSAIFWCILRHRLTRLTVGLCVLFFVVAEARILMRPQFTTTAFLAGTAGLLLLLDVLSQQTVSWLKAVPGFCFIALMVMVRSDVALLFVPLVAPFVLERLGVSHWKRLVLLAVVYGIIFVGLTSVDRAWYQRDAGWAQYREYNLIRGSIQKTPKTDFVEAVGPTIGWSANDGKMLVESFFADPETFGSVPKMRQLLDGLEKATWANLLKPTSIAHGLQDHFSKPINFGPAVDIAFGLSLLASCALLYFARGHRRRLGATLLVSYAFIEGIAFYLRYTARLPERVSYNMPFIMLTLCLYWGARLDEAPKPFAWLDKFPWHKVKVAPVYRGKIFRALLLVWFAALAFFTIDLLQNFHSMEKNHRQIKKVSEDFPKVFEQNWQGDSKPILVPLPQMSRLEESLFFVPAGTKMPFDLLPASWTTHSPVFYHFLKQHDLGSLSKDLVDCPNVLFLMQDPWKEILQTFYKEHYGWNIDFDLIISGDKWVRPGKKPRLHHAYKAKVVTAPPEQKSGL